MSEHCLSRRSVRIAANGITRRFEGSSAADGADVALWQTIGDLVVGINYTISAEFSLPTMISSKMKRAYVGGCRFSVSIGDHTRVTTIPETSSPAWTKYSENFTALYTSAPLMFNLTCDADVKNPDFELDLDMVTLSRIPGQKAPHFPSSANFTKTHSATHSRTHKATPTPTKTTCSNLVQNPSFEGLLNWAATGDAGRAKDSAAAFGSYVG